MKNKKSLYVILGIISLLVISGLGYFVYSQVTQSVLAVSSVNVGSDGKVYWVYYASANKPNEQYLFTSKPSTYTKSDGTQITPKSTLMLAISPKTPECVYQTTANTQKYGLIGVSEFTYYTLNNPQKKIDIEIADGNNVVKTLDGTTVQSLTIDDTDGSGSVTIQTQGILSGKYNCPNYDNVIIYKDDDGSIGYFDKSDWGDYSHWNTNIILKPTVSKLSNYINFNTGFTNSFDGTPSFNNLKVIGAINFGYPTFTITADQDYFDSTVYIPPEEAIPGIEKINIPSEIKQDDSSSGTIKISNSGDSGTVYLDISSDKFGISGYPSNFELDESKTVSFTIKAPNSVECGKITAKVCQTSQFTSSECDTSSKSLCSISSSDDPDEYCGDNICQSNENVNTCPSDCTEEDTGTETSQLECKWYQTLVQSQSCGLNPLCLVGITDPKTEQKCTLSGWIYLIVVMFILILIVSFFILKWRIQRRR